MTNQAKSTERKKYELAKNDNNFKVANQLIKATNFLDSVGIRVFCRLMSIRKPGENIIETSIRDIEKMVGVGHGGNNWKTVNRILAELRLTEMHLRLPAADLDIWKGEIPDDRIVDIKGTVVTTTSIDPVSRRIRIRINEDFIVVFDDVRNHYTWIYFEDLLMIQRSEYGARMYQWIRMHLAGCDFKDFIWYFNSSSEKEPGVRQFFGIPEGKYKRDRDLYKKVVDPTLVKLNNVLSHRLHVDYEPFNNPETGRTCGVYIKKIQWHDSRSKLTSIRMDSETVFGDEDVGNLVVSDLSANHDQAERITRRAIDLINTYGTNYQLNSTDTKRVAALLQAGFSEVEILLGTDKGCRYFQNWAPQNITPKAILDKEKFIIHQGRRFPWQPPGRYSLNRRDYPYLNDDEFHALSLELQQRMRNDAEDAILPEQVLDTYIRDYFYFSQITDLNNFLPVCEKKLKDFFDERPEMKTNDPRLKEFFDKYPEYGTSDL